MSKGMQASLDDDKLTPFEAGKNLGNGNRDPVPGEYALSDKGLVH